nr:MAG: capsid protein [Cressdnaviricota sp.]
MAHRRVRRGRRPSARRLRRHTRIGGKRTTMVRAKFGVDACAGRYWKAGDNTNVGNSGTIFNNLQELPAFVATASGTLFNAVVYAFDFPLSLLTANNPGYTAYSLAWDLFRIDKVSITLKTSIDPRRMLTQTLSGSATNQYNFSGELQYDPDVTWIDRDGSLSVNQTGGLLQANGDCSDEVLNRKGARAHGAFKTIHRSMRPQANVPVCAPIVGGQGSLIGSGPVLQVSDLQYMHTKMNPWRTISNQYGFMGVIFLAVSYKGPNLTMNIQPQYAWSCRSTFHMRLASPLFG